ncbi:hypothetical protein V8E36_006927 [Tilletia maclaganii]
MQTITIKHFNHPAFILEADPTDTIESLKSQIQLQQGHSIASQKLIINGHVQPNDRTNADLKLSERDYLVLMVDRSGAMHAPPPPPAPPPPLVSQSTEPTEALIDELRQITGCDHNQAVKALRAAANDKDKAIELIMTTLCGMG